MKTVFFFYSSRLPSHSSNRNQMLQNILKRLGKKSQEKKINKVIIRKYTEVIRKLIPAIPIK